MVGKGLSGSSRAVRVDPLSGSREIVEFVGDGDRMLRFLHLPAGEPSGTVVICSSVYAESMKNYRREVMLARELAANGVGAVRLHYRGTGNSMGDPAAMTVSGLVRDVFEAISDLSDQVPSSPGFLGTRIGAVVAAMAAPEGAPLALWEPVFNGDRWFKEGIRSAMISKVSRQVGESPADPASAISQIEAEGFLDVLGFALYRNLVNDIRRISLEDLLKGRKGRILLVQIGGGPDARPANVQVVHRLQSKGAEVELKVVGRDVAWWFEDVGPRDLANDDDIIEPTSAWLRREVTELR